MGIILGIIFIIIFIVIFIFPHKLINFFEKTGLFEFSLEKSGIKKFTTIRISSLIGIAIVFIFMSGSLQIIGGFIGIVIGFLTMKYSLRIHNIIGSGKWFKGDNGIKLAGIIILIISALWIAGVSQQVLQNFTRGILVQ